MRLFVALIYVVVAIIRAIALLVNRHRVNKERQPGRPPRQDTAARLGPVDKVGQFPDAVFHYDGAKSAGRSGDYIRAVSECSIALL